MRPATYAIALLVSTLSTLAAKAECDPAIILQQNTLSYAHSTVTDLAYLDSLRQHNEDNQANSASVSIPGYGALNANQKATYTSNIERLLDINYNNDQRTSLLISSLSPEAEQAYEACLRSQNQNVFVQASSDAMTSTDFSITIKLRPWVKQGDKFSVKITNIINGSLKDGGNQKIEDGGTAAIHVARDLTKNFSVTITVGTESETVDLPPQPMDIREETRYGQLLAAQSGRDTNVKPTQTWCVDIANDDPAIIIPNTAAFVLTGSTQAGALFNAAQNDSTSDKHECFRATWNQQGKTFTVCARGYARAQVVVAVKPGDPSSKYVAPGYLNDPNQLSGCWNH